MPKRLRLPLGVLLVLSAGVALAADPSAQQIFLATRAGHIAQAEQRVAQVLRDRPNSAKAHFVAAEVEARAGNFGTARSEFSRAQALAPGLTFASPRAVRELRRELATAPGGGAARAPRRAHLGGRCC
jgi:tetratricopeptide (TPR) repeat protein